MSRRSSAHQHVMQKAGVGRRRQHEAAARVRDGWRRDRSDAEPRDEPAHDRGGDAAHGPGSGQGPRDRGIRPVQQPAGQQRGCHVSCRHRCRRVMPGMPVTGGGVGHTCRPACLKAGVGRSRGTRPRQSEMQRALGGERARKDHAQGKPTAGDRPDEAELDQRERAHQAPWEGPFGDRVMAQGSEYRADEGEQPGTDACCGMPGRRAPVALVVSPRSTVSRHGHPPLPAPDDCQSA